jgi:hypothetical protein
VTHYYIGDGSRYVPGIPMRDLTDAEWRALPENLRKAAAKLFSTKNSNEEPDKPKKSAVQAAEPAKSEANKP